MRLKFLNRENELGRLRRAFSSEESSFSCIYGRRRIGKSRLLQESTFGYSRIYFQCDEREAPLQRTSFSNVVSDLIPGFNDVIYPDWNALLRRLWLELPPGAVIAIDEFPYLVNQSPEFPSILQRFLDTQVEKCIHLVISGSSQRMMHGLVLDEKAPLYGRAREIMKIQPLPAGWISDALNYRNFSECLRAYSIWGGIPRYWELAADHKSSFDAMESLILDPLGILYLEPQRLLLDDMRETVQASSILSLIGRGCSRMSEIAGRLEKPATSLTRPLKRLLNLGLIHREVPFGVNEKRSKSSLYRINDPFLRFWFRYVEPNRSRLESGMLCQVAQMIQKDFPVYLGEIWEELVRKAVPGLGPGGREWRLPSRWWGSNTEKAMMEIDVISESVDGKTLLAGECKLKLDRNRISETLDKLRNKVQKLPFATRYKEIVPILFIAEPSKAGSTSNHVVNGEAVMKVLR